MILYLVICSLCRFTVEFIRVLIMALFVIVAWVAYALTPHDD